MSIQDSTAGSREIPRRAGEGRGHDGAPNANVASPSPNNKLADAWLDGNRQLVEANEFFALAIEPDAVVKGAPGRKERQWVPSIWARRGNARALRA